MNINQLKENSIISNIVKTILDNDDFYNECQISLKEIYADKKLDTNDIPIILNLLVSVYNNYNTVEFDKNDIKEVFILLFIELIEKMNINDKLNSDEIVKLLEPQIDLLLISVKLNKGCIQKIKKLFSCCNNNIKDTKISNNKRP